MRTSVSYQQAWKCIRAKYASGAVGLVSFQVEPGRLIKKSSSLVKNSADAREKKRVKRIFFSKRNGNGKIYI